MWPLTYVSLCYCVCVCLWREETWWHGGVVGEYYCQQAPDASWQGHKVNRQGVGWTITVIHGWANIEGLCHREAHRAGFMQIYVWIYSCIFYTGSTLTHIKTYTCCEQIHSLSVSHKHTRISAHLLKKLQKKKQTCQTYVNDQSKYRHYHFSLDNGFSFVSVDCPCITSFSLNPLLQRTTVIVIKFNQNEVSTGSHSALCLVINISQWISH